MMSLAAGDNVQGRKHACMPHLHTPCGRTGAGTARTPGGRRCEAASSFSRSRSSSALCNATQDGRVGFCQKLQQHCMHACIR